MASEQLTEFAIVKSNEIKCEYDGILHEKPMKTTRLRSSEWALQTSTYI